MKTSIIRTDVWKDEELFSLHLDSKIIYIFLLSSPERGCISVFRWSKRLASAYTGISEAQIETAVKELKESGFIDIFEGYVGILKDHLGKNGYRWQTTNAANELAELPESVRAHFEGREPVVNAGTPKPVRKVTNLDALKPIINAQPEALRQPLLDFAADRIERKKPATTGAVKRWIAKLQKMYPNNIVKQVASIEQSIERGWSGMYEVKEDKEDRKFM